MKKKRSLFISILFVTLLYSYLSTAYLGAYYRVIELNGANFAELYISRYGYFLQAIGMFLYAFLFDKYRKVFNNKYFSIILIVVSIVPTSIMQLTTNISLLVFSTFIFNVLTGMLMELYLVHLAYYVPRNYIATSLGIAGAISSIFTFLSSYFDGGIFMESPEMLIIYVVMASIAAILLLNYEEIKEKETACITSKTKRHIALLTACIIIITVVVSLGDGIYSFGKWSSDADIRVVKAFNALGLIIAGIIADKNRRLFSIITVSIMSYFIISAFLFDNAMSASVMMSLGYFFMSFLSIYRFILVFDIVDEHPQLLSKVGYGLMISRVTEGLTALFMMMFPVSLTTHTIITLMFYSPLVILSVIMDGLLYSNNSNFENKRFIALCKKYELTSREQEICKLLISNYSDDEIAEKLFISKPTVRFHVSNIFKKTKTKSRTEAKRLFEI